MRFLLSALCVVCLSVAGLRGDDDEKQQPEEIPNFNQLDEYVYVPKSTLSLGTRLFLKGPTATYSGQGSIGGANSIPSTVMPGDYASTQVPNISRTYFDGSVLPDNRHYLYDNGVGLTQVSPVPLDGRTNSWSYDNPSQLLPNGDIAFHQYAGEVTDTDTHAAEGVPTTGLELILDRDMGKIGKHLSWSITAGLSIADIHSSTYANVPTTLTTLTDTYDLFGQVPPPAPYTSPTNLTQTVINSGGQPVSGSSGAVETQQANQEILIGNEPLNRTVVSTAVDSVNRYFIEGAYYTFRLGPTLILPMGQHFKLTMSAGPALLYAGSEFNVLEDLTLATGESFTELYQQENSKLIAGYYVDVDLRYELTDTAGFYLGGVYQGAGGFSQSMASGTGTSYSTHIDFGDQQGIKGGLTVRF